MMARSTPAPREYEETQASAGKALFVHCWTANDPLSPNGDGLGPVFNATSCAACHFQKGVGGAGDLEHNVTTFSLPGGRGQNPISGVVHSYATHAEYQETLKNANPALPNVARPTLGQVLDAVKSSGVILTVSQRNTPALFGDNLIDAIPDSAIIAQERMQQLRWRDLDGKGDTIPVGRALHLPGGRIGKFGWKSQNASLLEFVQAACANELGLGNPGAPQPKPMTAANFVTRGHDLSNEQCEQITAFVAMLKRPIEILPQDEHGQQQAEHGRQLFTKVGCAECHVPTLSNVQGIYSDLLLHRMGAELIGGGGYYAPDPQFPDSPGDFPLTDEWRTPPLWGVADSGPYLHDGRAATLQEAITQHGGQGTQAARAFGSLSGADQLDLIEFLNTLRAPL